MAASTMLPNVKVLQPPRALGVSVTFTVTNIRRMHCPPDRTEVFFWDASCGGFGLRALKSGRRSWVYQYRDKHGRTRRIALGDVSMVKLEAARAAARQHAASVTQGANPSVERKGKRTEPRVLDVVEAYLSQAKNRLRPRSY